MGEIEPQKRRSKDVAPRHIPQIVVPVGYDHVREFVRVALEGNPLINPLRQVLAGWIFFEPHVRFTPIDTTHTRIELDLVEAVHGAETLMSVQRRAEIDRFFVAIQDELDRRERWRPHSGTDGPPFEIADGLH